MRYLSRFLFWLGERDWFPFSTLRLWYWAIGYIKCDAEEVLEIDDGTYDYKRICHRCGWSEWDCDCGPLAELISI